MKWFINREGESPEGPYPLQKMANLTSFFEDTLVRRENDDEWIEAGEDPELEPIFESDVAWGKIRSQFRFNNATVQAGAPNSDQSVSNPPNTNSDSPDYPSYITEDASSPNGESTNDPNDSANPSNGEKATTEKSSITSPTVKGYDQKDSHTTSESSDENDASRSTRPSNGSSSDDVKSNGNRNGPNGKPPGTEPDEKRNHAENDDDKSTDAPAKTESEPASERDVEETDQEERYDYDRPQNGSDPATDSSEESSTDSDDEPRTIDSESSEETSDDESVTKTADTVPESTETTSEETTTEPEPESSTEEKEELSAAGFWNRTFAFLTDGLLLGLVGLVAGLSYFDVLAGLGPLGRLIGFGTAVAYFGVGNSWLTGGRTFGKYLFGIRVHSSEGTGLSLSHSIIRACVLGIPVFMFNLKLPTPAYTEFFFLSFQTVMILSVLGLGGGLIYMVLFNSDNRRSLHDYLADSVVLQESDTSKTPQQLPAMPGLHRSVLGCWLILLLVGITVAPYYLARQPELEATNTIQLSLVRTGSFHSVQIRPTVRGLQELRNGGPVTRFHVDLWYKNQPENLQGKLETLETSIRETLPPNARDGKLVIEGHYGFDLGLARSFKTRTLTSTG